MRACSECLLPLGIDDDTAEDRAEALMVRVGVVCDPCAEKFVSSNPVKGEGR
jgi:hypothetical protein